MPFFDTSGLRRTLSVLLVAAALSSSAHANSPSKTACRDVDYNKMILEIIASLPTGGGYDVRASRVALPVVSVHQLGARLGMHVRDGHPSHCTSATYALYTHLVARLHNSGKINLSVDQIRALQAVKTKPDGTSMFDGQGPFWIFNANGAGAAAFLKHTGTGISFRDDELLHARPGDFLKIFWNENVGVETYKNGGVNRSKSERGHQAVFTGRKVIADTEMICFWGSQKQGRTKRGKRREVRYFAAQPKGKVHNGYGEVCRPRGDIKHMIFSRIVCMENLASGLDAMRAKADLGGDVRIATPSAFVDEFLRSIQSRSSDHVTLDRLYDIRPAQEVFANKLAGR
jgi:hypothetical protein